MIIRGHVHYRAQTITLNMCWSLLASPSKTCLTMLLIQSALIVQSVCYIIHSVCVSMCERMWESVRMCVSVWLCVVTYPDVFSSSLGSAHLKVTLLGVVMVTGLPCVAWQPLPPRSCPAPLPTMLSSSARRSRKDREAGGDITGVALETGVGEDWFWITREIEQKKVSSPIHLHVNICTYYTTCEISSANMGF